MYQQYQAARDPQKKTWRRTALTLVALGLLIAQALSPEPVAAALPDSITFSIRVEQGDLSTVGRWLDAGLDPNFEGDRMNTGLMIAAGRGDIAMMELLVKHGADVNRTNLVKEQALMLAVWSGQREAVAWLLERGARINRDGKEWSALHYAAFAGHAELAELLVQKGADVNAKSTNGSTVLMMAARQGKEQIAAMLLAAGAERGTKNDWGEDALKWAMRNQHLTIAKMVSPDGKFVEAATRPQASWGEPVRSIPAPPEIENIRERERRAHASGEASDPAADEYRKLLESIAATKPAAIETRLPKRLSITATKGDPQKERAELQYDE